jgi:transcriptional regulator with XRE-family HTH domain
VSEVRSPTVRRRELGALLRALRSGRGLTVDQVATELLCSPSKVSRMETGQRGATARDIRDLCDLYGVDDAGERARLTRLAAEGKQQGWWQSYELPYSTYVGLEEEATSILSYHSAVVPGLLQTADYARAIHAAGLMPKLELEVIEQRVRERMKRQELLVQGRAPRYSVVLDEAVLHRKIGGSAVMSGQLNAIVGASVNSSVTIQILPYEAGAHPALESDFTLLEFASPVASVVYVEGLAGQIYLDRPQDVDRYTRVFERLHTLSLSPKDSMALVSDICKVYEGTTGAAG